MQDQRCASEPPLAARAWPLLTEVRHCTGRARVFRERRCPCRRSVSSSVRLEARCELPRQLLSLKCFLWEACQSEAWYATKAGEHLSKSSVAVGVRPSTSWLSKSYEQAKRSKENQARPQRSARKAWTCKRCTRELLAVRKLINMAAAVVLCSRHKFE